MSDLIFVVKNAKKWHTKNFAKNRNHYTGLVYYFGPKLISKLQPGLFPGHWNTFISLKNVPLRLKYGVIQQSWFEEDIL
jgi:hypothetical protein